MWHEGSDLTHTLCHLQDELKFNPFLRCQTPGLQAFTGKQDPVDVIGATRKAKDSF